MNDFNDFLSQVSGGPAAKLPNNLVDGTMAIGISFIVLAYFWHPAVGGAYDRMRAYRAWRAIEKRQAVEVTKYSPWTEAFGRQGMCVWDAARIITVVLGAFNLASWGLELTMDLYDLENEAWLLTQPPPVNRDGNSKTSTWIVLARDNVREGYDNIDQNSAKSLYLVKDFKDQIWSEGTNEIREGDVIVADWNSKEKPGTLSYAINGEFHQTVTVDKIGCSPLGDSLKKAPVITLRQDGTNETWGSVTECENGPRLQGQDQTIDSQPAIILTTVTEDVEGETYVIVEETAEKLSFLYSVWDAPSPGWENLTYTFHISSTVRLAEAVVTGIVNGKLNGRDCFALLRAYSMSIDDDFEYGDEPKASPFGENPKSVNVTLSDVETIEAGVVVSKFSMACFVLLLLLSLTGITWSFCLRSSIPINVYDRDALIRAVSLQGQSSTRDLSSTKPASTIRIFVRKEDTGNLTVVVSDAGEDNRSCLKRFFRRGGSVVETTDPVPVADTSSQYNDGFGGAAVPVGPHTVWLGGVRTGMGRAFPGREGNFHYPTSVALSASPAPSDAGRSLAGTPVALRSPLSSFVRPHEKRNSFRRDGRGPSVFFDSVRSTGSGGSGGSGGSVGSGGSGSPDAPGKTNSRRREVDGDERGAASDFFARAAAREME